MDIGGQPLIQPEFTVEFLRSARTIRRVNRIFISLRPMDILSGESVPVGNFIMRYMHQ
jgi:hypothetical protein